ncbi:HAD family hydrolase [Flammeovirga kamogawensis]|uniref:HAD family phosphatase n=1 Tax=Flammeovirga kamogawensis TaxID=373891 RepID=A0ABX8GSN3_9BACT|nr:HAD family phosphatase [Flammeovirga kamogawensis]MBB6463891.1 putative hydrolase of the HAD superfamily [Flammeovirga kamogawensis]QWG06585.1 HAD family phosphatase [Flammeovirga kamogawensis]TRX68411.1 HAD family phosphatase [Flammeovirga kamogawensis]
MKYKAIIFDLGGVLLNLRYENTLDKFSEILEKPVSPFYTQKEQTELFDEYEKGNISSDEFRLGIKKIVGEEITNDQIDEAWNAMLLDLPIKRVEMLKELSKKYRIFLLSNTNAIHIKAFETIVKSTLGNDFGDFKKLFEKGYYSYEMGDRKPHPSIFETVIAENNLDKSDTLFIDDSIQHVEGAKKAGLHAHHLSDLNVIKFLKDEGIY